MKAIFDALNAQEILKKGRNDALSQSFTAFTAHAATEAAGSPTPAAARYLSHAGVHVLLWLRHVEAHVYLPKTDLVDAGLPVSLVDLIVADAVSAWKSCGYTVTAAGLPELP